MAGPWETRGQGVPARGLWSPGQESAKSSATHLSGGSEKVNETPGLVFVIWRAHIFPPKLEYL